MLACLNYYAYVTVSKKPSMLVHKFWHIHGLKSHNPVASCSFNVTKVYSSMGK